MSILEEVPCRQLEAHLNKSNKVWFCTAWWICRLTIFFVIGPSEIDMCSQLSFVEVWRNQRPGDTRNGWKTTCFFLHPCIKVIKVSWPWSLRYLLGSSLFPICPEGVEVLTTCNAFLHSSASSPFAVAVSTKGWSPQQVQNLPRALDPAGHACAGHASTHMPEKISRVPARMPDGMAERMSGRMPGRVSEYMSSKLPTECQMECQNICQKEW